MSLQIVVIVLLLVTLGVIFWRSRGQSSSQGPAPASGRIWLEYGAFFIVLAGIVAAAAAYLITGLSFGSIFTESSQVLAALTALFGVIGTLVGTYFGVKSSSDARQGAENLARSGTTQPSPTVSSVNPPRNAENVDGQTNVAATFSTAMNPDTLTTDNFRLMFAATNERVEGTVTYDPSSVTATFTPANKPLQVGIYQATITTGAKDEAGNPLARDQIWQFTVA